MRKRNILWASLTVIGLAGLDFVIGFLFYSYFVIGLDWL